MGIVHVRFSTANGAFMTFCSSIGQARDTGMSQSRPIPKAYLNRGNVKVIGRVRSTDIIQCARETDQRSAQRLVSGPRVGNSYSQAAFTTCDKDPEQLQRSKSRSDVDYPDDLFGRVLCYGRTIRSFQLCRNTRRRNRSADASYHGFRIGRRNGVHPWWNGKTQNNFPYGRASSGHFGNVGVDAQSGMVLSSRIRASLQPVIRRSGNRGDRAAFHLRRRRNNLNTLNHRTLRVFSESLWFCAFVCVRSPILANWPAAPEGYTKC